MSLRTWILLGLVGCAPDISVIKQKVDADNDGYLEDVDCDDAHATVNPDAPEKCDGLDNDCDGVVDDDATDATTWYTDGDGDEFGDAVNVTCDVPPDAALVGGDCDDLDPAINPAEDEVCDGVDQDCDGDIDEDATDATAWYEDEDEDGFGDGPPTLACEAPVGQISEDGDCDDANDAIHPGAPEDDCTDPVDYNCDGSTRYADADSDSIPACQDCDDSDATAFPDAPEVCDEADNNCNGLIDEGVTTLFYADADGDSHGDGTSTTDACTAPPGYVSNTTDCDDGDGTVYPSAPEYCDGIDHDCDGAVDESGSVDAATWYRDADGDNYGVPTLTQVACDAPAGYVAASTDCDDTFDEVNPGASELCDPADIDEDCDGAADDADASAVGLTTWYLDSDGDDYGGTYTSRSCDQPAGHVPDGGDCDDADGAIHPDASEVCDSSDTDEDCDGLADDDDASATGKSVWYEDDDGDSYGDPTAYTRACDDPGAHASNSTDCDDADASINPLGTERCDSANVDEDCDGLADDEDTSASGKTSWYLDNDTDGYAGTTTTLACDLPAGAYTTADDCDDTDDTEYPGATEVCGDSIDQDCDGADEACPPPWTGDSVVSAGYRTRIYGQSSDRFSASLLGGDFDGDGVGDILVGDPLYTGSLYDGAVFGYAGEVASGNAYNTASYDMLVYNVASAYDGDLGDRLWSLGDLDEDGRDDWVVDVGSNTALMFLGGDSGTLTHSSAYDLLIYCTAAAGVGDMYVASATLDWACGYSAYSSQRGVVYLYGGVTSSPALATRTGEASSDLAGYAADGGGDVDGDGYPDLVVGAYGNDAGGSGSGAIYLEYGAMSGTATLATADVKITGPAASAQLGFTVYMPGDLDGDGHADIVAGAPGVTGSASTSGALYVFSAPVSGDAASVAEAIYYGEDAADQLGSGHNTVDFGDFDGDGLPDIVAGTPGNDDNGGNSGAVYVVYAPYSGTVTLPDAGGASWIGEEVNDYLGTSVAAIPDMNGDGRDEVALGARGADNAAGSDAGAVYIWQP